MRITTKQAGITTALLAAVALMGACEMGPRLEVRTFALENLRGHEASLLLDPYVFGNREGAPGALSVTGNAITVRETADNLAQIERVLAEYDKARSDVRLHFQLIEADGYTQTDQRIAAVEEELRKIFQFRGYRLAAESFVAATDGSPVGQLMQASDAMYELRGTVYWAGPNTIRLDEMNMYEVDTNHGLITTVNIRPGQTLVLGSSPKAGSTATLLLTVRAEEVPAINQ